MIKYLNNKLTLKKKTIQLWEYFSQQHWLSNKQTLQQLLPLISLQYWVTCGLAHGSV